MARKLIFIRLILPTTEEFKSRPYFSLIQDTPSITRIVVEEHNREFRAIYSEAGEYTKISDDSHGFPKWSTFSMSLSCVSTYLKPQMDGLERIKADKGSMAMAKSRGQWASLESTST